MNPIEFETIDYCNSDSVQSLNSHQVAELSRVIKKTKPYKMKSYEDIKILNIEEMELNRKIDKIKENATKTVKLQREFNDISNSTEILCFHYQSQYPEI